MVTNLFENPGNEDFPEKQLGFVENPAPVAKAVEISSKQYNFCVFSRSDKIYHLP